MNFETFYKKRSSRRCLGGRGMAQVRTCAVGFPPGRRGNGALRPKVASEALTQRVRSTVPPLAGGPVWTIAG